MCARRGAAPGTWGHEVEVAAGALTGPAVVNAVVGRANAVVNVLGPDSDQEGPSPFYWARRRSRRSSSASSERSNSSCAWSSDSMRRSRLTVGKSEMFNV